MKIGDVIELLEELAPLHYTEDFDNTGLLVGNLEDHLTGILVTLDTLEIVIDEAIAKGCNLIVSFHPIVFKGIKKLTGKNYVERTLIKAIKNDISIFSIHTALDNSKLGVNHKICEVLGIKNTRILIPKKGTLKKMVTYVPVKEAMALKQALFQIGAGNVGNYSHCSFASHGTGSYKGNEASNPSYGNKGELHLETEEQLHITFSAHLESLVIKTLLEKHPYEEVAYEVYTLNNTNQNIGMGMIGELERGQSQEDFFEHIKQRMGIPIIRYSKLLKQPIKKVAVLGGSGAFAIEAAKKAGANIFLTADLKYHNFFQAENKMVLVDIGHFESEQFTKNLLVDFLSKKIHNFAVTLSENITNPVNYF